MTMFPGAGATVYRNEVGEPLGWDYPSYDEGDPGDPYDMGDEWEPEYECDCGAFFDDEGDYLDHIEWCPEAA